LTIRGADKFAPLISLKAFVKMKRSLVYIDTDISLGTPGAEIDDGAALMVALRSQQPEVIGLGSVFGNTPVADTSRNLARLLSLLDKPAIPFGIGAAHPLQGTMDWFNEWQSGYGPTLPFDYSPPALSAAQLLIHLIHAHPGELTILSVGPMTNLAAALKQEPGIEKQVKQVIAMGGSFGTQSSEPEFNIHCDPHAAQMVFAADWPLTLLGLELTRQIAFSRADFTALPGSHAAINLFKEQAAGWIERVEAMGWEKDGCSLHDAVAAAYLIQPELFTCTDAEVSISLGGDLPIGATIIQPTGPYGKRKTKVVTQVDVPQCKRLIWDLINQIDSSQKSQ
jgi:inosine-uridine nucleoside N-ribohydrolase